MFEEPETVAIWTDECYWVKRRSCLRWLHCIKMNKKAEVADEEWRRVTQYRRQWKNVVHNRVATTLNKEAFYTTDLFY